MIQLVLLIDDVVEVISTNTSENLPLNENIISVGNVDLDSIYDVVITENQTTTKEF